MIAISGNIENKIPPSEKLNVRPEVLTETPETAITAESLDDKIKSIDGDIAIQKERIANLGTQLLSVYARLGVQPSPVEAQSITAIRKKILELEAQKKEVIEQRARLDQVDQEIQTEVGEENGGNPQRLENETDIEIRSKRFHSSLDALSRTYADVDTLAAKLREKRMEMSADQVAVEKFDTIFYRATAQGRPDIVSLNALIDPDNLYQESAFAEAAARVE